MKKIFWLLSLVVPMSANADSIEISVATQVFTVQNLVSNPASSDPQLGNNPVFFPGVLIPGFDSSLGTLQDVQVNLVSAWSLDVSLNVGNRGASTQINTVAIGATEFGIGLILPGTTNTRLFQQTEARCNTDESSCSSNSMIAGDFNLNLDTTGLFDGFVDNFVGLNLFNFLSLNTPCDAAREDVCAGSALTSWTGQVTATYTYSSSAGTGPGGPPVAVPEPGTLGLLGIGLAGMGFMRRRRKV